ncbi:MAG: ATP-binding cassette domain-containing protein, partial [Gammaproteobacteria bacterium]|nr:ATP-binding cassette domain-containing protein [Gammaproteobacteria bacterium]
GLIRLHEGSDADRLRDEMAAYLPDDVLVLTKQQFVQREKDYWNSATPIGYIFAFGAIMGFVVGAIIVYQILFADVSEHLNEYATLRAIGYKNRFVSGIVLQQAAILAVLGYLPGVAIVWWLYGKGELKKQILFDVSVEIRAGEIVIVTGPSGSGKTTMLTLVGALRSAQEGSVRVLGEELLKAKPGTLEKVRRQIGFIFQQHNLLGALSAVRNVELGIRASGKFPRSEHRQRAMDMLNAVGLGERIHHKPDELSGGQRQRVAIARALVSEPAMVLADEPTASLDRQSGREVVDRMKTLAKEHGATILLVTHDNRILDIADRIVHLEDGCLTTFTDAVIANNRHMMEMLADNRQKQPVGELVEQLDETQFRDLLQDITEESERFLETTALANNLAFKSMLDQGLVAFTSKLAGLLHAERSSLFLVDGDELVLKVADNLDEIGEIRIPVGSGIAGAAAMSGETIRIDDAYADPRFNREVDKKTGYRTRSIISLPVKNLEGEVFAVAQLLNRKDGEPFDANDEARFSEFIQSIGVIFETQLGLADAGR